MKTSGSLGVVVCEKREKDVSPKMLEAAAESLTLRRDVIRVIDAQLPRDEKLP